MITLVFRKRLSSAFSIEKLFTTLRVALVSRGMVVDAVELPRVSSNFVNVLSNAAFLSRRPRSKLLHITGDVHYAALFCVGVPKIITVHDCVVLQRGHGLKRWVFWLLWFRLPLLLADRVVAISEQTRSELLRVVSIPKHKMSVIPNFVDPCFQSTARTFCTAEPRILHIGTNSNKNLPRVVAALEGLRVVLVIVGRIDDETAKLLAGSGVKHETHVSIGESALLDLYKSADVISFPSTYEGFGMPILEGQAVGRPVLTSDSEPMRSVAGPGGAILVDPLSVASIRNGFESIIADAGLRRQLVDAGTRNVARYTLDSVVSRYADLYRSVARD